MLRVAYSHIRSQWMGALALFLVLGGGVAFAAFNPIGSDGDLDLCFERRSGDLDVKKGKKCNPGERSFAINQTGPRGLQGEQGVPGVPGAPGRDFTVDTTLPAGATEVGIFGGGQTLNADPGGAASEIAIPIQLRIPLPAPIAESHAIRVPPGSPSATHCPGKGSAEAGYFCLYEGFNYGSATFTEFDNTFDGAGGISKYGTVLAYNATSRRNIIHGSWAVTAP